jgi:hypothetical protein
MISTGRRQTLLLKLLLIGCTVGTIWAFSSGPPLALTGAFGEATCQLCHTGNNLNAAGGSLTISNVPQDYVPGQTYQIQVTIARSGQQRWGFELAARAASGGQQAGTLASTSNTTQVTTFSGVQYITHTSNGTFQGSQQGIWTFNWTAPPSPVGQVVFAAAGNAANGNFSNSGDFIYTATATTDAFVEDQITLIFPQVAVGGGYRTTFSLMNTGNTLLEGTLSLAQNDGSPMIVSFGSVQSSSVPVSIQPGGVQQITADPLNEGDPARGGWGKVESTGGTPGGVATYRLVDGGSLKIVVGVISSTRANAATIPLSDLGIESRHTAYALVNPGTNPINVRILLVDDQGNTVQTLQPANLNPVPAGGYFSRFIFEELNDSTFQFDGTMVFIADGTDVFSVMGLVLDRGLLTAIPILAGKAPHIGN